LDLDTLWQKAGLVQAGDCRSWQPARVAKAAAALFADGAVIKQFHSENFAGLADSFGQLDFLADGRWVVWRMFRD